MPPFGFQLINSHRRRVGTTIITSRWVDRRNENSFFFFLPRSLMSEIISLVSLCVRLLVLNRNIYKYFSHLRWLDAPLAFPSHNIYMLTVIFTFNIDRHSRSTNKISITSIERGAGARWLSTINMRLGKNNEEGAEGTGCIIKSIHRES